VRIARIEQSQGRFEESLVRLRRAAAGVDARWSAEALYFTGRALSHMGDHPQALDAFTRYLERRPDVPAAWQAVGKEMEATGDADGAETTYRAALERFPSDAGIVRLLVTLLERQGRAEEAAGIAVRPGASGASREVEEILRQLRQGGARSRP
jgi:tetratricopeptide (TPR) repeat protein